MSQLYIKIFGGVQGVGFRYSARTKALELRLTGYVRNLADGSVEILAQGEKANLEEFLDWTQAGPRFARIDKVEHTWTKLTKSFSDFEIRY